MMVKTMTVGELKKKLAQYSETMPVFLYNGLDEGDCELAKVEPVTRGYYCKGDSLVDEYFEENTAVTSVLLLHDSY